MSIPGRRFSESGFLTAKNARQGDNKNRSDALKIIAAEEKIDKPGAARKLEQSPKDGRLNLVGLQTVLDLRVQLGLMPPSAKELESYFDASVYREASAH